MAQITIFVEEHNYGKYPHTDNDGSYEPSEVLTFDTEKPDYDILYPACQAAWREENEPEFWMSGEQKFWDKVCQIVWARSYADIMEIMYEEDGMLFY